MEDKSFSRIVAKFVPHPSHKHTLKPELLSLEGESAEFMYAWLMDDEDTFPGVWALTTEDKRWLGLWVPEFDLQIITPPNTACTRLETGAAKSDDESSPAVSSG